MRKKNSQELELMLLSLKWQLDGMTLVLSGVDIKGKNNGSFEWKHLWREEKA